LDGHSEALRESKEMIIKEVSDSLQIAESKCGGKESQELNRLEDELGILFLGLDDIRDNGLKQRLDLDLFQRLSVNSN
jgi:hypothetical protein